MDQALRKDFLKYTAYTVLFLLFEMGMLFLNYRDTRVPLNMPRSYDETVEDYAKQVKKGSGMKRPEAKRASPLEKRLVSSGLIDVAMIVPGIRVELKYSSPDNFLGQDVYGDLDKCYLPVDIALRLEACQKYLKDRYPYYSLKIYDGVRPLSIQRKMWNALKLSDAYKSLYVANPDSISLHNFGAAVDVTLVDEDGLECDMGTAFDHFGELGFPLAEQKMLEEGRLLYRQVENRNLLREVMSKGGFTPITTEWWHFNACSRETARQKYTLIE